MQKTSSNGYHDDTVIDLTDIDFSGKPFESDAMETIIAEPNDVLYFQKYDGNRIRVGVKRGSLPKQNFELTIPAYFGNLPIDTISDSAFKDCSNLVSVVLPDSIVEIGDNAFEGCSELESINLPQKLLKIGHYGFKNCTELRDLELPIGLKEIGWSAFEGCSSLCSVKIPGSVSVIESNAFEGCELSNVEIGEGVEIVETMAFSDNWFSEIIFPGSLKSIGVCAFSRCDSLVRVTLPENAVIDDTAFDDADTVVVRRV